MVMLSFTAIVVWHDKQISAVDWASNLTFVEAQVQDPGAFKSFVEQINLNHTKPGFYCLGIAGAQPWPTKPSRACYRDAVAARWQFTDVSESYGKTMDLIRYRSKEDFLELLMIAEKNQPGFIAALDFKIHRPVTEPALALSLKLLIGFLSGVVGLLIVRSVLK